MRKLFFLLSLMLIASVGNLAFAQTQWAEYDTPAAATAVAVTDNAIFVFTAEQYYQVGFPLPPSGATLPWAQMIIPGEGSIKAGVVTPDGIVFALRENGNLWRLINGEWENIFPDQVEGLSEIKGNRFFAWSATTLYEYNNGFTQMPFNDTKALAFNDEYVMVFTENSGNYSGPNSWSLSPTEEFNNFYPAEAAMTDNEYVVAGTVITGLAAWHQSPPDACVPFTHVLTSGFINSVAATKDTAWAVGRLGEKGVLFNTTDMSGIYVVPETVWQIRANNLGVLAAVSENRLYVRGNTEIVALKPQLSAQSDLRIAPNPIENGILCIIFGSNREAWISDLNGKQVAVLLLYEGENQVNMSFLPAGVYLLEGKKFVIP